MARGKGRGHKGQHRRFTNPEELAAERAKDEKWGHRDKRDGDDDDDEEGSGSESDSSEDDSSKRKGVAGLIEVENPNRLAKKQPKMDKLGADLGRPSASTAAPAAASGGGDGPELSRREREELEKQRAREAYQRLHDAGKTDQARADLARLAIIKQQREEAAKKREEERKMKELEKTQKRAAATGKK